MTPPTFLLGLLDEVERCPVLDATPRVLKLRLHCYGAASLGTQLAQSDQRGTGDGGGEREEGKGWLYNALEINSGIDSP